MSSLGFQIGYKFGICGIKKAHVSVQLDCSCSGFLDYWIVEVQELTENVIGVYLKRSILKVPNMCVSSVQTVDLGGVLWSVNNQRLLTAPFPLLVTQLEGKEAQTWLRLHKVDEKHKRGTGDEKDGARGGCISSETQTEPQMDV